MQTQSSHKLLISGKSVYLRKVTQADKQEFTSKAKVSDDLHKPWVYPPADDQAYCYYLERIAQVEHAGLLVCLIKTQEIAGVINVNHMIRGALSSAFLGFYAFNGYTKRGVMTEGLQLTSRYAFETLKLHRLEANIQPNNEPSIALVKRCGFRKEGFSPKYLKINCIWQDHERYAITVEDYKKLVQPKDQHT